jgi:hypothetical protein
MIDKKIKKYVSQNLPEEAINTYIPAAHVTMH